MGAEHASSDLVGLLSAILVESRVPTNIAPVANTSYFRSEVEGYVRKRLAKEFGQPFVAEVLTLRPGGRHEFDAVASDGTVVAGVKSASGLTSGGRIPAAKIKDCLAEVYFLSLVDAPIRRLILTTPEFYEIFTRLTTGKIAEGIELVSMPLPARIQGEVDRIVREASREMSPAVASAAIAGEVETVLGDSPPAS